MPKTGLKPLEELFRARVIAFLVDKGLLPPERARMLRGWVHSGVNVHRGRRVLSASARTWLFVAGAGRVVILLGKQPDQHDYRCPPGLLRARPEVFAGQVGAIVSGPQACTISATGGQTAITITGYAPEPRARTLVAGGQLYQVAVTSLWDDRAGGALGRDDGKLCRPNLLRRDRPPPFITCWAMLRLRADWAALCRSLRPADLPQYARWLDHRRLRAIRGRPRPRDHHEGLIL